MTPLLLTFLFATHIDDVDSHTPIAMVLTPGKGATFQRGQSQSRPLRAMGILLSGDRLQAGEEPISLVVLADGHGEIVRASAQVVVRPEGCTPATAVERQTTKLSAAHLQGLRRLATNGRSGALVLRTARSNVIPAIYPVNGATVLSGQPSFCWPAEPGATHYIAQLLQGSEAKEKSVWKVETTIPRLSYPSGQAPIPAGEERRWRVSSRAADGKEKALFEAKLTVATKSDAESMATLQPLAAGTNPAGWILAAATYETFGAYDEAYALYQRLASHFKDEPEFQRALAVYFERAGHPDLAREARKKAEALLAASEPKPPSR